MKRKEKSSAERARSEHGVRFSDKISNLKFHRNFTILGSKLIVLSTGTFNRPRRRPSTLSRTPVPLSTQCHRPPGLWPLREGNFENKQPITHYSLRLSERSQRRSEGSFWWPYNDFDFDI